MLKRKAIQLSFKNEGDDLALYTFLKQKLNAPSYIKEILWSVYKNECLLTQTVITQPTFISSYQTNKAVEVPIVLERSEDEENRILFKEDIVRDTIDF